MRTMLMLRSSLPGRWRAAALTLTLLFAACAEEEEQISYLVERPPLETTADTIAMRAFEGFGGPEAWAALPYLRFDFGAENEEGRQVRRKHLWNRRTGDYRVEWTAGADSQYVALFNVDSREGQVYRNGTALDSLENAEALQQAYRGFINDTYWLLAPTKMFDPGVQRTYVPDSADAGVDVVRLSFQDVGLTPGDQYWMYVDQQTGRLDRWDFVLQGGGEGRFRWTGYEPHPTAAGTLYVATRKEAVDRPSALLTDNVEMPAEVDESLFTDPTPRL